MWGVVQLARGSEETPQEYSWDGRIEACTLIFIFLFSTCLKLIDCVKYSAGQCSGGAGSVGIRCWDTAIACKLAVDNEDANKT